MPQDISSIQGGVVVVVVVVVVLVVVVVVAVVVVTVVVVVEVVVVDVVVVGTVGFVAGVVAGGLVDPGIGRSPQSTVQGQLQMWLTSSNNVPGPQHL